MALSYVYFSSVKSLKVNRWNIWTKSHNSSISLLSQPDHYAFPKPQTWPKQEQKEQDGKWSQARDGVC